ncbi:MAG TPA: DUF1223 domain-containing protein [Anaeromyxobacter sp.]
MMARSLLALTLVGLAGPARGEVPVLVELFTSEGCSSCPPADALLARLAQERAGGARPIALSEHVDYWDDLGWRDGFSSPAFTRRQETYVHRLRLSAPYTPQLVVAGRINALGSDARAARAAIAAAAREPAGRIDARVVARAAGALTVEIEASWNGGVAGDVLLALAQDRATTRVARGENEGRTLEHVSVARSLSVVGSGVGAFSGRATVRLGDVPAPAHLVVFVQERDGGPVHAVTSIAVP